MAALLFAGGKYGIKSEVLEMQTGSEIPGEHRQGSGFLLRWRDWYTREKGVVARLARGTGTLLRDPPAFSMWSAHAQAKAACV